MQKVAVIGLDGCAWTLLDRWIAEGKLPTMRRLREQGAWGTMQSCLPPVTSPNWRCYATGLNPGQLGVFWWDNVDFATHRIILSRAPLFHGAPIWEQLGRAGHRVLVVNFPTTYPPPSVNGVLISGGPDALEHQFTSPRELEAELKERYKYRVHSSLIDFIDDPAQKDRVADDIIRIIRSRFTVTEDLLERVDPDFLHLTIYYINVLQHHFWDDPVVLRAWEVIDEGIASLMQKLPDWQFLFMSDHGTNLIRVQFNISTWLQQQGYLVLRPQTGRSRNLVARAGLNRDRAARLAARLGVKDQIKRWLGPSAGTFLPSEGGLVRMDAREQRIDWERSRVIASGQGPVYVNPNLGSERDQFIDHLARQLGDLVDETGYPIARQIFRKEEVYSGQFLDRAPDLVIDQNDGVHITPSIGFPTAFQPPHKWRAENHKIGLFAAYGSQIGAGHLEVQPKITDLAPTILHMYGVPALTEMEGRVVQEIFAPDSPMLGEQQERQDRSDDDDAQGLSVGEEEEQEIIAERLRALGYM